MGIEFDSRVSWMDVVAIGMVAATALGVIFGVQSGVEVNAQDIAANREEIRREIIRVDTQAEKDRHEILDRIKETQKSMEVVRVESASGRKSIEDKIDRLIERELNQ